MPLSVGTSTLTHPAFRAISPTTPPGMQLGMSAFWNGLTVERMARPRARNTQTRLKVGNPGGTMLLPMTTPRPKRPPRGFRGERFHWEGESFPFRL